MLIKLVMKLQYNREEKLSYQISSVMHGILMEHVSYEFGEELHLNGVKPFSQYITNMKEDSFQWNICTMTENAKKEIIDSLCKKKEFYMKHKDLKLEVMDVSMTSIGYEELTEKYYFKEQPRYIDLQFLTPTAFKSNGCYVFFPSVRHIFQSLMNKYDTFSLESSIGSQEVLEHLEKYVQVNKYQLKSVRFSLEGVRIPAFIGSFTLKVNGPQQLVNLANMLIAFGEFSGVGIKSTLGMGAIINRERVR
ncbi:MAG: CRISPR-associated endoribonuclease Cas6 [Anaerostipes sp.]|nr:CRISPR-associated endoribonuclease Cas6 [Anaerostipes sp.]